MLAQHNYELTEGQLARRQRPTWRESDPAFSWSGNTTRQQRPSRHGAPRWREIAALPVARGAEE